jgi:hypothetical protein
MPCEDYEDEAIAMANAADPPSFRRLVSSVCRVVHDTYEHPRDVLSQLRSVRVFGLTGARDTSAIDPKGQAPGGDRPLF